MATTRTRSPVGITLVAAVLAALVTALVLSFLLEDEDPVAEAPELTLGEVPEDAPQVDIAGQPAPDFRFEPLTGGDEADFAAFRNGQPAVINFFAEWCAPCVQEMPAFEAAHQEYGDHVAFLGLSFNETEEDGLEIVERTGVTYETGRDPSGDILAEYGGIYMPTTVFVAADGTITAHHTGGMRPGEIEEELEELV